MLAVTAYLASRFVFDTGMTTTTPGSFPFQVPKLGARRQSWPHAHVYIRVRTSLNAVSLPARNQVRCWCSRVTWGAALLSLTHPSSILKKCAIQPTIVRSVVTGGKPCILILLSCIRIPCSHNLLWFALTLLGLTITILCILHLQENRSFTSSGHCT